jgi:hypothetical protein
MPGPQLLSDRRNCFRKLQNFDAAVFLQISGIDISK